MDPRQSLLAAWADIATASTTTVPLVQADERDFLWLGPAGGLFSAPLARAVQIPESPMAERLASIDALSPETHVLREGWVFLAGTIQRGDAPQRVLLPLLTRPVRLRSQPRRSALATAVNQSVALMVGAGTSTGVQLSLDGEPEITPLVEEPARAAALADRAEFGRGFFDRETYTPVTDRDITTLLQRMPALRRWIDDVARATGLVPADAHVPLHSRDPRPAMGEQGLRAFVGSAVFVAQERTRGVAASALQAWAQHPDLGRSSFAVLYGTDADRAPTADPPPDAAALESPFVLSPSQATVVRAARTRPLTVVSGAPGTGKSHTVAAIALDHVARGHSVLIATRSRFAARAIADLIHRVPGPNALRFGDIVEGSSVVDELNDHLLDQLPIDAEAELRAAIAERDGVRAAVTACLRLELEAHDAGGPIAAQRVVAPLAFELDADLPRLAALATDVQRPVRGWFAKRRQRRARQQLAEAIGAPVADAALVAEAIDRARRRRAALLLDEDGGTVIGEVWDHLRAAEDRVHVAVGAAARERQDHGRRARGAVSELLAALRAGRGRRRQLLTQIDADALTAAVPLWIGTLGDIEDLLPARTASFDLVILDEAAHVDQPGAAPALLRGKRAVVVGDPRQLRHVSFLADETIDRAMADHGLAHQTSAVDLRRNSIFDRAAATSPIIDLAEHYRSVPHLVAFPISEFYRDRIEVMTRRPDNDEVDVIDVEVPAEPTRASEVEHVIALLAKRLADGPTETIGVATPFREHADAIQAAVLARFSEDEIRALGLRIGTVHGFQGAERDAMVLALGVTPDDAAKRLGFLENRNLFNVMVTRARRTQTIVTSVTAPREGLLAKYLRHADQAPRPLPDQGTSDAWANALATELARAGFATHLGYDVGPWHLELVLDDGGEAIAFETCVTGGDPAAHLARHQALTGLGWRFVEAYPSRWDHEVATAALALPALIDAARRDRLPAPPVVRRVRDLGRTPPG